MTTDSQTKSKKAYLVSLKHKLKRHLQLQSASVTQVDRRWLNGFMAAGFPWWLNQACMAGFNNA